MRDRYSSRRAVDARDATRVCPLTPPPPFHPSISRTLAIHCSSVLSALDPGSVRIGLGIIFQARVLIISPFPESICETRAATSAIGQRMRTVQQPAGCIGRGARKLPIFHLL